MAVVFADTNIVQKSEAVFAIPAHNANVKWIFSLMSTQRSNERNKLSVKTIEAILIRHNFTPNFIIMLKKKLI